MKLLSSELLRLARNLENAPLTDVLQAAIIVLDANREFAAGILQLLGRPLDVELFERTVKPVLRELVKRRLELELGIPQARGQA